MKIIYLSSARVPDSWAHVLQILTMCEAFAHAGAEVELVVPRRAKTPNIDPYAYADVQRIFTITRLPCLDFFAGTQGKFFYWLRTVSFFIAAKVYLAFKKYNFLYTREHQAGLFFRNFLYEMHAIPKGGDALYKSIWKKVSGFIVLTSFIKAELVKQGFPAERIHVAPDAVDVKKFQTNTTKREAREQLGLSPDVYLVGYVGTLKTMQMEKGITCAVEALADVGPEVRLCVVGGESEDIEEYQALAEKKGLSRRILFVGKVPHSEVPAYLRAFDVVIAPFPDFEHYRWYMSPLKIFEYMAAKVPMIVSDLPSLREVLTEKTAIFIPPANSKRLAEAIKSLQANPQEGIQLAAQAFEDARNKYSWVSRAQGIIRFVEKVYG